MADIERTIPELQDGGPAQANDQVEAFRQSNPSQSLKVTLPDVSQKLDTDLGNADSDLTTSEQLAFREKINALGGDDTIPTTYNDITGMVPESAIPASIARDGEVTAGLARKLDRDMQNLETTLTDTQTAYIRRLLGIDDPGPSGTVTNQDLSRLLSHTATTIPDLAPFTMTLAANPDGASSTDQETVTLAIPDTWPETGQSSLHFTVTATGMTGVVYVQPEIRMQASQGGTYTGPNIALDPQGSVDISIAVEGRTDVQLSVQAIEHVELLSDVSFTFTVENITLVQDGILRAEAIALIDSRVGQGVAEAKATADQANQRSLANAADITQIEHKTDHLELTNLAGNEVAVAAADSNGNIVGDITASSQGNALVGVPSEIPKSQLRFYVNDTRIGLPNLVASRTVNTEDGQETYFYYSVLVAAGDVVHVTQQPVAEGLAIQGELNTLGTRVAGTEATDRTLRSELEDGVLAALRQGSVTERDDREVIPSPANIHLGEQRGLADGTPFLSGLRTARNPDNNLYLIADPWDESGAPTFRFDNRLLVIEQARSDSDGTLVLKAARHQAAQPEQTSTRTRYLAQRNGAGAGAPIREPLGFRGADERTAFSYENSLPPDDSVPVTMDIRFELNGADWGTTTLTLAAGQRENTVRIFGNRGSVTNFDSGASVRLTRTGVIAGVTGYAVRIASTSQNFAIIQGGFLELRSRWTETYVSQHATPAQTVYEEVATRHEQGSVVFGFDPTGSTIKLWFDTGEIDTGFAPPSALATRLNTMFTDTMNSSLSYYGVASGITAFQITDLHVIQTAAYSGAEGIGMFQDRVTHQETITLTTRLAVPAADGTIFTLNPQNSGGTINSYQQLGEIPENLVPASIARDTEIAGKLDTDLSNVDTLTATEQSNFRDAIGAGGVTSFSDLSGQIADSQIPSGIARDSEIPTNLNQLTGQVSDTQIPSGIARDSEIPTNLNQLTGNVSDSQIPDSITRDTELAAGLAGKTNTGTTSAVTSRVSTLEGNRLRTNLSNVANLTGTQQSDFRTAIGAAAGSATISFSDVQGQIADGQIPSGIARDSELPDNLNDLAGRASDAQLPRYVSDITYSNTTDRLSVTQRGGGLAVGVTNFDVDVDKADTDLQNISSSLTSAERDVVKSRLGITEGGGGQIIGGFSSTEVFNRDIDFTLGNSFVLPENVNGDGGLTITPGRWWLFNLGQRRSVDVSVAQWEWISTDDILALIAAVAGGVPNRANAIVIGEAGAEGLIDISLSRTSGNRLLVSSAASSDDTLPLRIRELTPGEAGGGASSFSDLTGQIADSQIPSGIARDSEIPDVSGKADVNLQNISNLSASQGSTVRSRIGAASSTDVSGKADVNLQNVSTLTAAQSSTFQSRTSTASADLSNLDSSLTTTEQNNIKTKLNITEGGGDVSGKADTDLQNIDSDLTGAERASVRDKLGIANLTSSITLEQRLTLWGQLGINPFDPAVRDTVLIDELATTGTGTGRLLSLSFPAGLSLPDYLYISISIVDNRRNSSSAVVPTQGLLASVGLPGTLNAQSAAYGNAAQISISTNTAIQGVMYVLNDRAFVALTEPVRALVHGLRI